MRRQKFEMLLIGAAARRLRIIGTAACIALCTLPSYAQDALVGPAPARDLQSIIDSGLLRVAVTRFDLPSFHSLRPDGTLSGAEVEMARQIGRAMGIKVEFIKDADSFDAVVDLVAGGRADIGISKLSQTYNRLQRVRFSEPYLTLRHALLFKRAAIARGANGQSPAVVLQGFHGKLGVIAGSAYVDFAKANFPEADVMEARTWQDAIASLLAGEVDAIYRDEFEIRRIVKNSPALNVQFGTAAIVDQNALLSIAICDTCSKLQELINFHLGQTKNNITLKTLLDSDAGK
jgi:ABC-type amino acid transport substrate-binding protein